MLQLDTEAGKHAAQSKQNEQKQVRETSVETSGRQE